MTRRNTSVYFSDNHIKKIKKVSEQLKKSKSSKYGFSSIVRIMTIDALKNKNIHEIKNLLESDEDE